MPWITTDKPLAVGDKLLSSLGEVTVEEVVNRPEHDEALVVLRHGIGRAYVAHGKATELPRWRP